LVRLTWRVSSRPGTGVERMVCESFVGKING
jgi:hypothetical protein